MPTVTCPTAVSTADGSPHTIVGCGSSNVAEDPDEPGLYDCLDCGIWFIPALEQRPVSKPGGRRGVA